MPTTVEDLNRSCRAVREEIDAWLRGARLLRRHGLFRQADFIECHAADYKAWAADRPVPV